MSDEDKHFAIDRIIRMVKHAAGQGRQSCIVRLDAIRPSVFFAKTLSSTEAVSGRDPKPEFPRYPDTMPTFLSAWLDEHDFTFEDPIVLPGTDLTGEEDRLGFTVSW